MFSVLRAPLLRARAAAQNVIRKSTTAPAPKKYEVGFVGLGAMGFPMAMNMQKQFQMGVWNRTQDKAKAHSSTYGTTHVEDIADFDCEVLFCCLPTSQDVEEVAKRLPTGKLKVFVDCTSGNWEDTIRIGEYLQKEKGITMVDCPVSGGPRGAYAGSVTAMFGGPKEAVDRAMEYSLFAEVKEHIGPLGAGHATKAVNNILNTSNLMLATEGLLALRNAGVSPELALKVINKSSGRSLQSIVRIPEEVLDRRFGYGFKLNLMVKDVSIANSLIQQKFPDAQVLPEVARVMNDVLERYKDTPNVDYTRLSEYLEEKAGVKLTRQKDDHQD